MSGAADPAGAGPRGTSYAISPRRVAFGRKTARGLLPTWRELGTAIPRYFRQSYHPSQEGSLRKAVEYLAASPAARAAAGAVGRAAMS